MNVIPEYNESLYEVSENWENEEANEEFEPPVPLIKSGKPFPTHLMIYNQLKGIPSPKI